MTKKEAKIEALRIAVAHLNNPPQFNKEDGVSLEDEEKILKELKIITEALRKKSVRLGGDFNQYTGF